MDKNYPTEQTTENAYVKVREKKSGGKVLALFITVLLLAAVCWLLYKGSQEKIDGFLSGLLGTKQSSETTADTQTTSPPESTGIPDIYGYDLSTLAQGMLPVIPTDMSALRSGIKYDNNSGYQLSGFPVYDIPMLDGTVLVTNTHPYEAYLDDGTYSIADGADVNSGDSNVRAAALVLVEKLNSLGISARYLETANSSRYSSYSNAYRVLEDCLKNDSTICLVIDIQRGTDTDGQNALAPVTYINGKVCAQIRMNVGTDAFGQESPAWRDKLTLANTVTYKAGEAYPSLFCPTRISGSRLNQHISVPMLTCDIGTCFNTFSQACNGAEVLSEVISRLFAGKSE